MRVSVLGWRQYILDVPQRREKWWVTTLIQQTLEKCTIFKGIPAVLLTLLTDVAEIRHYARGEFLYHQGAEPDWVYIVARGMVRLVQHTEDGKSITMHTCVSGDPLALVFSLIGEPFSGGAEAAEDSDVILLPVEVVWEVIQQHPPLMLNVLKMVAGRLREAHNRIRELSAEKAERRIARSTLRLVEKVGVPMLDGAIHLDMRLTRQDLAEMSGTTLETVSRTLTAWEREAIIKSSRERLTILQPHILTGIVEELE